MTTPLATPAPGARRHRFDRRRIGAIAVIVVVALAVLTGLGLIISTIGDRDSDSSSGSSAATSNSAGSGSETGGDLSPATAPKTAGASPPAGADAATGGGSSAPGTGTLAAVPVPANRVVQTGQLALEVGKSKVQPTLDRLGGIATTAGGFLTSSRSAAGVGSPSGTSTLRVPTAKFDAVVAQVRTLGHVTSISTSAKDVTADYVDLGARISALEDTRATFLTLLSRATSIGDTLAVQQQIQPVQQQIEQLQGQQQLLANRSDLATLAVSVGEVDAPIRTTEPAQHKRTGFAAAWHRTVTGFNVGLQALITIVGPLLLILVVGGVIALGVRAVLRLRLRRREPHSYSE